MIPKKGYNDAKYRANYDLIFRKPNVICDFCGLVISPNNFESGAAIRKTDEAYHVICKEKADILRESGGFESTWDKA